MRMRTTLLGIAMVAVAALAVSGTASATESGAVEATSPATCVEASGEHPLVQATILGHEINAGGGDYNVRVCV